MFFSQKTWGIYLSLLVGEWFKLYCFLIMLACGEEGSHDAVSQGLPVQLQDPASG
jgi:hypothetical protein